MKRWTHALLTVALIGAFAGVFCPRSPAPGELVPPAESDALVESFPETVGLRVVAKRLIARDAAAGRRSLVEAAALFAALNRLPPETTRLVRHNPAHPLPHLRGRTDEEVLCLQVIAHAGVEQPGELRDQVKAAVARLEAEYIAQLRERGAIHLPDPSGLPPAAELLEWARAEMTELERRALLNTGGVVTPRTGPNPPPGLSRPSP